MSVPSPSPQPTTTPAPGSNPPPAEAVGLDEVTEAYDEVISSLTQKVVSGILVRNRQSAEIEALRDRVAQQDRVIQQLQSASEASTPA